MLARLIGRLLCLVPADWHLWNLFVGINVANVIWLDFGVCDDDVGFPDGFVEPQSDRILGIQLDQSDKTLSEDGSFFGYRSVSNDGSL